MFLRPECFKYSGFFLRTCEILTTPSITLCTLPVNNFVIVLVLKLILIGLFLRLKNISLKAKRLHLRQPKTLSIRSYYLSILRCCYFLLFDFWGCCCHCMLLFACSRLFIILSKKIRNKEYIPIGARSFKIIKIL